MIVSKAAHAAKKTAGLLLLLVLLPAFAAFVACSSSSGPPPVGDGPQPTGTTTTTMQPPPDSGGPVADATADGAKPVDAAAGDAIGDAPDAADAGNGGGSSCGDAMAAGSIVEEVEEQQPVPQPTGGPITAGTYVLAGLEEFGATSGGTTGLVEQKTLILGEGTYSYDEAVGTANDADTIGAPSLSGGTFAMVGASTLQLTQLCPGPATRSFPFIASGGQLSLFNGDHVENFELMQ